MHELIPSFLSLVQIYSGCFRQEVFVTFQQMLCGWLVCSGRRTISRVWEITGLASKNDHNSAFRLFSQAKWNWDKICCLLVQQIVEHFVSGKEIYIVVDDTLCYKRGTHVAFRGLYRDAVLSTEKRNFFRFGHNWVLLGIVVKLPQRPDRHFCLPVLWRLYKKKGDQKKRHHRTKNELAAEMVSLLAQTLPEHRFILLGDDAYISRAVIKNIPDNVEVIGPIDWVATIYTAPRDAKNSGRGRIPTCGQRLPTLKEILRNNKRWPRKPFTFRHGKRKKKLQIKILDDVLWYRTAGNKRFRIVFIHDPTGEWRDEVLCCSDLSISANDIIYTYGMRFSVEVAFYDTKQQLGFHDPMVWTKNSVERAAPFSWFVSTLIVLWYAKSGFAVKQAVRERPWYRQKCSPSFADMLATCRLHHWREVYLRQSASNPLCHKKTNWLINYLATGTF